ncbi:DegT/DnrJ/EryC1/StrS family aminotransferase [Breznakiella homolactica]|uniref:DegT/DnrJ/EryC1/StrS aminotransferase family protein n=1 Tax=Breznakiella homolactica TaxID=2798577 RepID=A0A7T8BA27_9SPIR|nr:DegT/DnrJ/EryC1/StrS family aminotransferase [Breznakiella homolactica]QQO08555.1 DegT/DnrJ/EryC1/StrS family aminotransferase [Breznakiella homolactica]
MNIEVYSPTIRRKEMDAVLTAMVEDKIGPGDQSQRLVQTAKEYLQYDYSLAVRSPAIALYLALKSMGIADGSGVLISALSPRYYTWVIEGLRLVPLYCDVESGSACISAKTVQAAIARKDAGMEPRCLVIHHALGYVPDTVSLAELGIPIIEDCSRSYGTASEGSPLPSAGVFTILGLEERDMLTAGGGALLYAANRRDGSVLRNYGDIPPEYSLPDMNAALAVIQFKESRRNLEKRKDIAEVYIQSSLRTRHKRFIETDGIGYNNYAFPLILETGMKDVVAYAKKKEVSVENAFGDTLVGSGAIPPEQCPEAYSLSLRTALFPLYPRLASSQTAKVAKLIAALP